MCRVCVALIVFSVGVEYLSLSVVVVRRGGKKKAAAKADPPAPAKPEAKPTMADNLIQAGCWVLALIGYVTVLLWLDGKYVHPPLPAGWECLQVTRGSSYGDHRAVRCGPAPGWHIERWPGGNEQAVPDQAVITRRS